MPPRGKIERPQDRRGVILRLLRYMMRYKGILFLAVALTVSSNLLQLVGPTLCGLAIDAVEGGPGHVDFARVFLYAGWMVAFYAASSVLSFALSLNQSAYLSAVSGHSFQLLSENRIAMSSLNREFFNNNFNFGLMAFVYRKFGLFHPKTCLAPSVNMPRKPISATRSPIWSE